MSFSDNLEGIFFRSSKYSLLDLSMCMARSKRRIQYRYHVQKYSWRIEYSSKLSKIPRLHTHNMLCYLHRTHNRAKYRYRLKILKSSYSTFSMFSLKLIFVITDILTPSTPLVSAIFTILSYRVNKRFHSLIIRALIFLKIHYIEFVGKSYWSIHQLRIYILPFLIFLTEK